MEDFTNKFDTLTTEQQSEIEKFGSNKWFVLDLLDTYLKSPDMVSEDWQHFFNRITRKPNGHPAAGNSVGTPQVSIPMPKPTEQDETILLKGVGQKIVQNMEYSLSIPTATSLRTIPVKLLEENRRTINQFLARNNGGKISFTHMIAWGLVKALQKFPNLNNAFTLVDGQPTMLRRSYINLGIAVDLPKADGSRSLIVPNIKGAEQMNFREFVDEYNDIIRRSRDKKIEPADFMGTTLSLTNPGTVGTVSSNPRLMLGQGAIIATGSIDYPAEFQAMAPSTISTLGLSKVLNVTSTYDHRIIQGAESGLFLQYLHKLLLDEDDFYENIFRDMSIPLKPIIWQDDLKPRAFGGAGRMERIEKEARVLELVRLYRVRGHLMANLDPLGFKGKLHHPELDPSSYGFTIWDLDRTFISLGLSGDDTLSLKEILDILQQTYCNKIGVEYMHIQDPDEKTWLQQKMEPSRNTANFDAEWKKRILEKLATAESFERFLQTKYPGHKRFSLEGSETIVPVLDYITNLAAEEDVEEIVLGMSHRGRLNVLANIIGKSRTKMFSEFSGDIDQESVQGSGDVKYHLGADGIYKTVSGRRIKIGVAPNPSHLEWVNPVVEGIVRSKQTQLGDKTRSQVIPVLLHGDAAFAGQGIVPETVNLSQLKGYRTGGTIHIIVNNQIGFTTSPTEARSTEYATDVAKMVQAPIFHVNGDDVEASLWVAQLAYEYRQRFKKDVVIDVLGYRRHGHNEGDEPSFTQPLMYKKIKVHPSVTTIYTEQLIKSGAITKAEAQAILDKIHADLEAAFEAAKHTESKPPEKRIMKPELGTQPIKPATEEMLNQIIGTISAVPDNFEPHEKLRKLVESRAKLIEEEVPMDWAFAEALALGTILLEGISIRFSGEDISRGTFSQRHMALTDMNNAAEVILLNQLAGTTARVEAVDSLLSEGAVLGFEFGYATSHPNTLVLWGSAVWGLCQRGPGYY